MIVINRMWGPASPTGFLIASLGFVTDWLSKYWLLSVLQSKPIGTRITITPFMDVVLVWNTGVSYGLFTNNSEVGRWFLIILIVAIIAVVIVWLARVQGWLLALALGLIIGGALGNLYDRLVYGAVADFFSLHAWGYYWYVFNLADVWIVVGAALMVWNSVRLFSAGENQN
ncbi:MAG: signal peptidase II [Parvularculales bacterium]